MKRSLACLLVLSLSVIAHAQLMILSPPTETMGVKNQIQLMQQSLQANMLPDAASRIDALIHDNGDALISTDGGALMSVRTALSQMPLAQRLAIMPAYDTVVGPEAKQALDAATVRPGNRPEDFFAIIDQYPFSTAARDAYGRAALRSLELGDCSSAMVLAAKAAELGWKPTDAQKAQLDAAAGLVSPPPAGVPFVAPWYNLDPPIAYRRVLPVQADTSIFFSTEHGICAAKDTGELLWQWTAPKSEQSFAGARLSVQRPAVWCDPSGKPQIVIARQLIPGTRFGCLRAFRASDGKLLWSTETNTSLGSWSLASLPAVLGRQVVVLAIDESAKPVPIGVMAFETTTGKLLWQTTLSTFANLTEGREPGSFREVDALWNNTGPAIDGGQVFVCTGFGLNACVDRFDGKIQWLRWFTPTLSPGDELIDLAKRNGHDPAAHELFHKQLDQMRKVAGKLTLQPTPPGQPRVHHELGDEIEALAAFFSQPLRWASTPAVSGKAMVAGSIDMSTVTAYDRLTGATIWESNDEYKASSLIGLAGGQAILCGAGVVGLNPQTGKPSWTWNSPSAKPIDGPAAIDGKNLRVISGGKISVLAADTGEPSSLTSPGMGLKPLLANEPTRSALSNIEALPSVSPPVLHGK